MPVSKSEKPRSAQIEASRQQQEIAAMSQIRAVYAVSELAESASLSGSRSLHHNGNCEPKKDGSEIREKQPLSGDQSGPRKMCALLVQNPRRANPRHIMKILRLNPKNSPKKEFFFWLGVHKMLLKTK